MFMAFVRSFQFVICYDFFSHSSEFTFILSHVLVIMCSLSWRECQNCVSYRPHRTCIHPYISLTTGSRGWPGVSSSLLVVPAVPGHTISHHNPRGERVCIPAFSASVLSSLFLAKLNCSPLEPTILWGRDMLPGLSQSLPIPGTGVG